MLPKKTNLSPSAYSELYDILIPKDNKLRKLANLVDFSFVRDELKDKYSIDMGRTAIDPVQMFKYVLLKAIYNLSDRDLVERAKTDLSLKFFLGLNPEDDIIHPSLLSKFRRQRLKDESLLEILIRKSVEIAVEYKILEKDAVIIDATHTAACFNQNSPIQALKKAATLLKRKVYEIDNSMKEILPESYNGRKLSDEQKYVDNLLSIIQKRKNLLKLERISEPFNKLTELQEDLKEYLKYSKDPDARVGHKSKEKSFFGYKTHLAMSKNGIITAAVVTSGERGDGKYLEPLIIESNKNGMNVKEIIGDCAYSGRKNLKFTQENDITLMSKLTTAITKGTRKSGEIWDYNKDAQSFICPAGEISYKTLLRDKAGVGEKRNKSLVYYFDIKKCNTCPLRDKCFKPGAKTKTYSVTIKDNEYQEQESFEKSEYFKKEVKKRYRIEAKNAELKIQHGYNKSWSSGISAMTLQGAMTILYVNMKRILKLIDENE
ncbi:IS1182 family transposase [Companilactobacillus farciminis]